MKKRFVKYPLRLKLKLLGTLLLGFCALLWSVNGGFAQEVSPELFSGLSWRLIGPFRGGRAVAVSGVPGDSRTFYFGAVNGGIWKTTDAGTVWLPIFDGQPVASIGAITVAPSDPTVIYAGTGESDIRSDLASGDGVYKSTDAGKSWRNIGLKDSRQISRIVVDAQNPDVVYVGVLGHAYGPNAERGVYKSTDGGTTWKHVLDNGPEVGVSDLAIAARNPQVLIAGTWNARRPPWSVYGPIGGPGSGLYRSTDSGESWTQLTGHGLPNGEWGRVGVALSPDGKRIYALIEAKASGLYRSDDGGDSWTLENSDSRLTSRAWYFNSVTIDPSNPDVLYVPNVALYRSEDGGKTISIVRGAPGGDDYHQIWVDPKDPSSLLLGTDQGTTISLDHGKTWTSWYNQPTAQFYHVTTNNEFPYMVYGAQQDSGSAGVPSRTDHLQITPRDWVTATGAEGGYIAVDPNDPNIIYETDTYGVVERFDRRTSLSQNIAPWTVSPLYTANSLPGAFDASGSIATRKYRDPWTPVLVFSPADRKTLYLGTQYVMATTDGGLHWQKISPDLTGGEAAKMKLNTAGPPSVADARERGFGVVFTIAPSPLKPSEVWAGSDSGLIHITQDAGKTWVDVTPEGLAAWSNISLIEASRFDAGVAYAAVDRHEMDDYRPYLYRTRDFGKSWQRIENGFAPNAFLRAVREDPEKKGLLFAGTELGVYVSFDDGDHWEPLQLNLPVTSVRDLQIHSDDLVIATHGRSFWILDDITPLRQIHTGMTCQGACFYRPASAVRVDNNNFPGTPLPPEEPTAKNPPNGATLDYVLLEQAQPVTLTIFDQHKQVIRRFSSTDKEVGERPPAPIAERWFPKPEHLENTAGMHRFVWDLRWRNSGNSVDEDDDSAAPGGPRVPPGTYEVELKVDSKKFDQSFTVRMDPRSSASAAVLNGQFQLSKEIFEQTLRTRGALAEVSSVQSKLAELTPDQMAQHPELSAQVTDLQAIIGSILKGAANKLPEITGLAGANAALNTALNAVEGGDRAVPAQFMTIYQQSKQEAERQIAAWDVAKKTELKALNETLRRDGLTTVSISEIEQEVEELKTR